MKPTKAWGSIKTSAAGRTFFTTAITGEGGILIALNSEETYDLPVGD